MIRTVQAMVIGLVALAGTVATVWAQDPVPLYPENYKVLFENERVRVLDFRLKKGATEQAHSHLAHVAVFLADFTIRFTPPVAASNRAQERIADASS